MYEPAVAKTNCEHGNCDGDGVDGEEPNGAVEGGLQGDCHPLCQANAAQHRLQHIAEEKHIDVAGEYPRKTGDGMQVFLQVYEGNLMECEAGDERQGDAKRQCPTEH